MTNNKLHNSLSIGTSWSFSVFRTVQAPRRSHTKPLPLLRQLHWLPVQHRITYLLAVLAYKVRTTSTPAYLSRHIRLRDSVRALYARPRPLDCLNRSPVQHLPSVHSAVLLQPPGTLCQKVIDSKSLGIFKSRLKSFTSFLEHTTDNTTFRQRLWGYDLTALYNLLLLLQRLMTLDELELS